jgi:hypothetical protein
VICAHGSARLPNSSGYFDVLVDVGPQLLEVLGASVLSVQHLPLGFVCVHRHAQLGHDSWEVLSDVLSIASGACAGGGGGARSGDFLQHDDDVQDYRLYMYMI